MPATDIPNEKILVCDDHPICCFGIRTSLDAIPSSRRREYHFAHSGEQALTLAKQHSFSIVFMDMKLPGLSGTEALGRMTRNPSGPKNILVTSHTDLATAEALKRAVLRVPVHAILQKTFSVETLAKALEHVSADPAAPFLDPAIAGLFAKLDESSLTQREFDIVHLITTGLTTKEIALRLNCSHETIKTHRANVLEKTRSKNVAELSAWYSDRYGKSDPSA